MSAISVRHEIDPSVDSAPKPYQPIDYGFHSFFIFTVVFFFAAIPSMVLTDLPSDTFASKYAFEADLVNQAANHVKWTAGIVSIVSIGLYLLPPAMIILLEKKKNWCQKSLIFDQEMQKHPWEKPYSMIALSIAAAGIAILLSTVLVQYCPGMQALNDYYAGCDKSGYAMCAVDMRDVYTSMDRLAGWNSYWDVMTVTGTALAAIGAMSFWHLQRRKNKEPEAIQLDSPVRGT